MYSFSISAEKSSNAIRTPAFPVLESGNVSFPNGRYIVDIVEINREASSLTIRHKIEGAPLISRLLRKEQAVYTCTVSTPKSSYRETYISKTEEQCIQLNYGDLGEPPLLTPMIVFSVSDSNYKLDLQKDGVNEIWHNQRITLKKGSRLARAVVIRFLSSSVLQLLTLVADEDLDVGVFRVGAEVEDGFRFRVRLAPELLQFLQKDGTDGIRKHILTNVVTACLALLQREFAGDSEEDGGWRSYPDLKALSDYFKEKNLPHWSDEGFYPEEVATKLYPHHIPSISEDE